MRNGKTLGTDLRGGRPLGVVENGSKENVRTAVVQDIERGVCIQIKGMLIQGDFIVYRH